jgi:L-arabinose 1-dehydrogenase [NAD(P)+]
MDVAITGAAGQVGRLATAALDADDVHLFTHSEHDDIEGDVLEVTDADAVDDALDGVDCVVHCAWGPADPDAWNEDHEANVRGVFNVLDAATANGLDRVVVPSTIHVAGMYNRDQPGEMESLSTEPTTPVGAADRPRPDSYYGVANVTCEALGSFYADRYGLEVVVLRIGWVMSAETLRETESDAPGRHRYARATWLSPRDCRHAIERSVHADLSANPVVTFVTSANDDRYLSLTAGLVHLGYRPRDNAALELDSRDGTDETQPDGTDP